MNRSVIDRLGDPDPRVVSRCLAELYPGGPEDRPEASLQALAMVLRRKETALREDAMLVLTDFASPDSCRIILDFLNEVIHDESAIVRERVLELFQRIPATVSFKEQLIPLLEDPVASVRINAAIAIWRHTTDFPSIESVVSASLQDADYTVICLACQVVGEIGLVPDVVLNQLIQLLRHEVGTVRANALRALSRAWTDEAALLETASALINDAEPSVRSVAERLVARRKSR